MLDPVDASIIGLKDILKFAEYGKAISSMLSSYLLSGFVHKGATIVDVVRQFIDDRKQLYRIARSYGADKKYFNDPMMAVRCLLADLSGAEQEFPKWLDLLEKIKLLDPEAHTTTTDEGESWYLKCSVYITSNGGSYSGISGWAHSEPEAVYLAWGVLVTNLKPKQYVVKSTEYHAPRYRWNGNEWEITHEAK
jgi:hypothetical protein